MCNLHHPSGLYRVGASPFLKRHREPFLKQVKDRKAVLKVQFEAIDTLEYRPSYALAVELVSEFLWSLE